MNLNQMTVSELKQLAASLNIPLKGRVLKKELIEQIQALQQATDSANQKEAEPIETKRTSREKESRRLGRYKLNDNIEEAVVYEGAVRVLPEGYGIIDRQNELGIYCWPHRFRNSALKLAMCSEAVCARLSLEKNTRPCSFWIASTANERPTSSKKWKS